MRFMRWSLVLAVIPAAGLALGAPVANAGGSCHSPASAATGDLVSLSGLCFGPTVLYVRSGDEVTWTNRDSVTHTVTGLGFMWGSANGLAQGDSLSYRFTQAGVYPYSCIIHPGMVGAVVVGDAGSPSAVQGLAVPVPAPSIAPAAEAGEPAPAAVSRATSSQLWKVISFISLGLLVAMAVTATLRRRSLPRSASLEKD
jgi:plastocyanin